jgi:alanyl-tRNA synthetase
VTERLYYHDSYLRDFTATVVDATADGRTVYLDRTAFYPASGGQPRDAGVIAGVPVLDVIDEEDRVGHVLETPLTASSSVQCEVDWARRFDHMQQHTGQHLLSAVLARDFGAETVSFHMGAEASTIDLAVASLEPARLREAERRANDAVFENRAVTVAFEEAATVEGLRKAPDRAGSLRIVSIDGLDRSACGGTHLRSTGELGCILLRSVERVRGNVRLEFLCGGRAVRRARADYDALSAAARSFAASLDAVPQLVAAQTDRSGELEKARRKLAAELAGYRGRELFAATPAGASGRRLHVREVAALEEDVRVEAQAFTAGANAVFVAWSREPAAILIAASTDAGVHAGNALKAIVTAAGGRGGGSAQLAQGSVPNPTAARDAVAKLAADLA